MALGIASFALVSAYAAFTGGLVNLRASKERAAMALRAEEVVAAARAAPVVEGESAGVFPDGYSWRLNARPYGWDETPEGARPVELTNASRLLRITVTVTGRNDETLVLETLKVETDDG